MLQQVIISIVVIGAASYVAWTFLSMTARQSLLDRLAGLGLFANAARRHRARLSTPGCSNCAASTPASITPPRKR
jgi:hypothetical protein